MDTNCYLVFDEDTNKGIVIDPADEGDYISQKILENQIDLQSIVLTHGHFDHILGALELKLNFNSPIYLNERDYNLYKNASKSARFWLKRPSDPLPVIDEYIKEGKQIVFGSSSLQVLETPGHTPGSICLYSSDQNAVFTGDTLFKRGLGRTDHKYSSAMKLSESLDKLFQLPDQTIAYPGHGDFTYLGDERRLLGR